MKILVDPSKARTIVEGCMDDSTSSTDNHSHSTDNSRKHTDTSEKAWTTSGNFEAPTNDFIC